MTREEYRKKLSRIIGDESSVIELMIDLDNVIKHDLPPAEGAKTCWNCGIELRYSPNGVTAYHCACGAVNPGERLQQPTAEGAKEILTAEEFIREKIRQKLEIKGEMKRLWTYGCNGEDALRWSHEFATLHAQKIADKMAEERLRDEKAFTDWCINHVEIESREEKYIIDNETTIYSFSDLMDYWNRYLKQRQL